MNKNLIIVKIIKKLKMITNIDFLSPPITLFHLEKRTHTSKVGAFLVIALIIICSSYVLFLLVNLIYHKQMTYIFHKKFQYEAGYYSFNPSSIFHFIQIFAPDNGGYFDKFDTRYLRAYTTYVQSNLTYDNLHLYDHWVFDQCQSNIDDKDLDSSLFSNIENFTNGVCIKHFYNSKERKYYFFGEEGFKWPYLEHGIAQRNNIYLTTIVQKCSNNSVTNKIFGECPPQKEIDDYISKYFGIYLYFTDTQVDPTDYKKPITKYLQVVSTGIGNSQTYVESYIHFSPVKILTKIGSILGESSEINSFYFDFNRKGAANNAGQKYFIITRYYHLMQNNVQIYERRYNNIFDLFSEIGGIAQFIFYLFYWINFVYNQFIINIDTNSMFFSIKEEKSKNKRNNNYHINPMPNKIKINGNDNKIYNIQNNILNLSKKEMKKYRNSKFYINPKNKSDKSNDLIIKKNSSNKVNKNIVNFNYTDTEQFKGRNMNRERTITAYKINDDNSREILNNLKIKKKLDYTPSLNSFHKYCILKIDNRSNNSNSKLKYNKEIIIKPNNSNSNINNKNLIDDDEEDKKNDKNDPKNIMNNISISKVSINNIDYDNPSASHKLKHISSIIDFTKSLVFKKEKTNCYYINLFRKHLLSEEHLLKSHITTVLIEKKYNIDNDEKTNFFECFEKL